MTLFNFSDLAGKNAPLPKLTQRGHRTLLGWSTARALFLPLFLLAMRLGAPAAVIGALTVTLGVSNGWVRWRRGRRLRGRPRSVRAWRNNHAFNVLRQALLGWCMRPVSFVQLNFCMQLYRDLARIQSGEDLHPAPCSIPQNPSTPKVPHCTGDDERARRRPQCSCR
jgi:hypothetical protein